MFLGSPPAAPVFMFLMGVSLIMSRKHDVKQGIYRGAKLLLLAYALNFFRETLPAIIVLVLQPITEQELAPYLLSESFWVVDILHFAGLALIILSIVRHYFKKPLYWLAMAISIAICSPLLWGWMSGVPIVDWLLTLFWGVGGEMVAFPIFPWLAYPLCGMAFGYWLQRTDNRDTFMKQSAMIGILCLIVGSIIIATDFDYHVGDYWRSGPGALLWISGFVLGELYLCHKIVAHIPSNSLFKVLYYWSSNVTVFYFIQWIIIGWFSFVEIDSIPLSLVVMALVMIATDTCTRIWIGRYECHTGL